MYLRIPTFSCVSSTFLSCRADDRQSNCLIMQQVRRKMRDRVISGTLRLLFNNYRISIVEKCYPMKRCYYYFFSTSIQKLALRCAKRTRKRGIIVKWIIVADGICRSNGAKCFRSRFRWLMCSYERKYCWKNMDSATKRRMC